MNKLTSHNLLVLLFLLFGIQQLCLAPWVWPFFKKNQETSVPQIKNVIFDLGGVLMQTSNKQAVSHIGLSKILYYLLTFNNPKNIYPKLYSTLDLMLPLDPDGPQALTPDGSRLLPQIMRNWLSGDMTCSQCRDLSVSFIDEHKEAFKSTAERKLLQATITTTFTPEAIVDIQQVVADGIEFVKQCKDRGLKVFILSNLDAESYELLNKANPELFSLFEEKNIFVSGKMNLIKPDHAIYELLLSEAGLEADTCVFFDDQQENVMAARACGINAFQCRQKHGQPDYASLEKQLNILMQSQERLAITRSAYPS